MLARRTPLNATQQGLVVQFKPLAHRLAHKWVRKTGGDLDEFESEAFQALCRAALCFDPRRGVKFITYAYKAIDLSLWRFNKYRLPRLPMASQDDRDEYRGCDPPGREPAPIAAAERSELLALVHQLLTRREEDALLSVHYHGQTLQQVGVRLGCSKERIRQLNFRSCKRLAKAMR